MHLLLVAETSTLEACHAPYLDPVADAGETAAALEAFARSVRMFADPADMYPAMLALDASLHALTVCCANSRIQHTRFADSG